MNTSPDRLANALVHSTRLHLIDECGMTNIYNNQEVRDLLLYAAALAAHRDEPASRQEADKGPWSVAKWREERTVLVSGDFTHDAALVVAGDFGSTFERVAYAEKLAAFMNAALAQATPSDKGTGK